MNTGQSLLTIMAIVLLSVLVLRVNGTFLTTSSTLVNTKLGLLATSIAQSELNSITELAFDENSANANTAITDPSGFSSVLGAESGETADSLYNDIDDYNGHVRIDSSTPTIKFEVLDSVYYVSENNPDQRSAINTWYKKITVRVIDTTKKYMTDTIKVSTIFSYWYFK